MAEVTTKTQFEFVFNAMRGVQTVQVINLGMELGLLDALRAAPAGLTAAELAGQFKLHAPYVRVWCEAGYAFGVLELNGDRFQLAPRLDTVLLDTDHPRYLGAFVRGFTSFLADDFARYPAAFKDGSVHAFGDHGAEFSAWVSTLTHPMQRLVVGKLLPELFGPQLEQGLNVLDVGCGAGQLLLKLAKMFPNGRYTGVDVDGHGVALAQDAADWLEIPVTFQHTPIDALDNPGTYDLALMFEVLHELPVNVRPDVLKGCFRALRPGGKLFILDETWPDDPAQLRDPAYAMSVLVQFSELVWGNVVATESEQTRLLTDAGFTDLHRGDLGGVFTTIVATKSG